MGYSIHNPKDHPALVIFIKILTLYQYHTYTLSLLTDRDCARTGRNKERSMEGARRNEGRGGCKGKVGGGVGI